MTLRAKKSLGQHFLKSERALSDIVTAGNLTHGDTVLEIGPGRGVLTKALLETGATVIAVEKDRELFPHLWELFEKELREKRLTLVEGDILDFDPALHKLRPQSYKLIANIPYYITGAIIRKFLETNAKPSCMVLLVQDEVARRIVARDGKESLLSLSVKAFGTPRYVAKVPRGAFSPAPSVDSAVLAIDAISGNAFKKGEEKRFFEILHAGFAHKRKKLAKNLETVAKKGDIAGAFTALGLAENTRAEDVPTELWLQVARML